MGRPRQTLDEEIRSLRATAERTTRNRTSSRLDTPARAPNRPCRSAAARTSALPSNSRIRSGVAGRSCAKTAAVGAKCTNVEGQACCARMPRWTTSASAPEREKTDTAKYALTKFAKDSHCRSATICSARSQRCRKMAVEHRSGAEKLARGRDDDRARVRLGVLERHGVQRIDPKGQPFNPHHHQAVMEQANPRCRPAPCSRCSRPAIT